MSVNITSIYIIKSKDYEYYLYEYLISLLKVSIVIHTTLAAALENQSQTLQKIAENR